MSDIQKIYEMLNWENADEIRAKGFRLAKKIEDLSLLILPPAAPSVWECCAQVLSEKPDIVLEPYLNSLLDWLQDLNWPGALIILDRLKVFSGEKLKEPFIDRFAYANNLNTEEGLMWLDYLSELLDNEELKAVLPKPIIEKLQKHYKNWGFWYDD
mgnify:CR=1 FL=1